MKTNPAEIFLESFASTLKARGVLPKKIEISRLGNVVLASAFDAEPSSAISEYVFSGMDPDPNVAVIKSLVEKCERNAFAEGYRHGDSACQTERSDGFAAFPIGIVQDTQGTARKNAFHEAVERYVWAKWWDNPEISHELTPRSDFSQLEPSLSILTHLNALLPLGTVYEVRPAISGRADLAVVLFFALLKGGGVISGGACEHPRDTARARFRALSELARHGLAFDRMRTNGLRATSFYERRLAYFAADPAGESSAIERILARGTAKLSLPELMIDHAVSHSLEDKVAVHRCLLQDQPPFVGGSLERLCL